MKRGDRIGRTGPTDAAKVAGLKLRMRKGKKREAE